MQKGPVLSTGVPFVTPLPRSRLADRSAVAIVSLIEREVCCAIVFTRLAGLMAYYFALRRWLGIGALALVGSALSAAASCGCSRA